MADHGNGNGNGAWYAALMRRDGLLIAVLILTSFKGNIAKGLGMSAEEDEPTVYEKQVLRELKAIRTRSAATETKVNMMLTVARDQGLVPKIPEIP